ncbi:DUF4342 domain-containing protein [Nonomuraea gerenzanensis]|uniref:DUF4342 domain-containing protein n=1 Tax=Nonomuraea gerenzanensis TaxID=93944 RepID=A0A1M4EBP2_9ACTN|nr:DUF4342 domain-containing protein [Nonomuraea gerenzanensis]UBU18296.1 DUF4342 domain-containing protein [Nonomuraea gerenzanensis]SBO96118.1 hypothetical protein BN4615_P5634 [Nonomuraea gerenzanensis]
MTATRESVEAGGTEFADKVRYVLHEGHVRRVIVKTAHGRTVMNVPLTAGAVAFVAAPFLTVVAGLAAVAADWTITIERPVQDVADADVPVAAGVVADDGSRTPAA